jgi:parvulin-like peptidyl-prolyl isomerase
MKILRQNIYKHSHRQINIIQNLDFDSMITEKVNTVMNLDKDEQELLDSIKNDNWVSIPDSKLEIQRFQEIAKHQISMQKIELQVSLQDSDTI